MRPLASFLCMVITMIVVFGLVSEFPDKRWIAGLSGLGVTLLTLYASEICSALKKRNE